MSCHLSYLHLLSCSDNRNCWIISGYPSNVWRLLVYSLVTDFWVQLWARSKIYFLFHFLTSALKISLPFWSNNLHKYEYKWQYLAYTSNISHIKTIICSKTLLKSSIGKYYISQVFAESFESSQLTTSTSNISKS